MSEEFLERVNKAAQNWSGEVRGAADIVNDFPLYGHARRAEALDQIDAEISRIGSVEGDDDLKSYTRLTSLRRNLGQTHSALIKVGR